MVSKEELARTALDQDERLVAQEAAHLVAGEAIRKAEANAAQQEEVGNKVVGFGCWSHLLFKRSSLLTRACYLPLIVLENLSRRSLSENRCLWFQPT